MNQFVKDFLENGYFEYPIPPKLAEQFARFRKSWQMFYTQPMRHRLIHTFDDYLGGYEYNGPEKRDHKQIFHITSEYELPKKSSLVDIELVMTGKNLLIPAKKIVSDMIEIMSEAVNVDLSVMAMGGLKTSSFRLINYPPRPKNFPKIWAAAHIDKGLTSHWDESCSGFEIKWNGEWKKVRHHRNKIMGYFGMLGQFYSKCNFPALNHRVVGTPTSYLKGRDTTVLFSDFGDVRYDKATWGSTQEVFSDCENYDMNFEKFSKYFIPIKR